MYTLPQLGAVLLKHLVETAKVKVPVQHYTPSSEYPLPPVATVNAFSHGVLWLPQGKRTKPRPVGVFRTHDGVVDLLTKTPGVRLVEGRLCLHGRGQLCWS